MANGLAGHKMIENHTAEYEQFKDMLHTVTTALSIAIANDGEGATKLIAVAVNHAQSALDVRMVAKKLSVPH